MLQIGEPRSRFLWRTPLQQQVVEQGLAPDSLELISVAVTEQLLGNYLPRRAIVLGSTLQAGAQASALRKGDMVSADV